MQLLDDQKNFERYDPAGMRVRIAELPDQIEKAIDAFVEVTIPAHYVQARNMIMLGMGGSAIGGELATVLAADHNPLPVEIRRDYDLPAYVNKDSIVVGISYSGNTEETLSGFRKAAAKGAKLLAVTTGGELGSLGRKFQIPVFTIEYESQPRAAMGYLFTAAIVIFQKLRLYPAGLQELHEAARLLRSLSEKLAPTVPVANNHAKTLAVKIRDRLPLIIGSGAMGVVARRWKTQINENAKLAAFYDGLPELCHNTIVGMERIWKQRDMLAPILLTSSTTHSRNQLRADIVSRILTNLKLPIETVVIHPAGTPLAEALQMVMLGDYVSYYLAILAGTDPTPVVPIEKLKKELAQYPFDNM